MPELRDKTFPNFKPSTDQVDIHAIPFLDKVREAARQKRLAAELAAGGKNAKQIKAEQRQFQWKQQQKEKRQEAIAKGRNPNKKKGRNAQLMDEWDELAKEERLFKKLRRKKISEGEYKRLLKEKTGLGGRGSGKRQRAGQDDSDSDNGHDSDSS